MDLASYLSSKGHRTFKAAGSEVTAVCWWCNETNDKKKKLYLNTESWMYSCKVCQASGNRKTLLKYFGDEARDDLAWLPGQNPAMRRRALSEATDLAADMLLANPAMLKYLTGRGLSVETIVDARLGFVPAAWSLVHELKTAGNEWANLRSAGIATAEGQNFFSNHITIPYLTHGDVVQLRGRSMGAGAKYVTPGGDQCRLFNVDALHGAKHAIIVEGEFDCLMLATTLRLSLDPVLRATAVVGVPGSQSLPTSFASYFEQCAKVYVGFDPDEAGKTGALRVKEMLGSKARILTLPEDLPEADWSDYLRPLDVESNPHGGHGWRDVQRLVWGADTEGRRLYTARDAYLQWQHIEDEIGGIQLGFSDLDKWMAPGLKPGQLCIPIARTATGKTQFLINIAYNIRKRPTLFVSLEMTASEVYARLRRVAQFWHPMATDDDITNELVNLRIVDQKMREGDLSRLCEEFEDEVGVAPQMAMVDYLGYFAASVKGASPYERVSKAVISLKEEAKACQVALIVPHQAGRSAAGGTPVTITDARDSGGVEDTADVLLSLYRPSDADHDGNAVDGTVRSELLKNRNGRHDVTTSLNFSLASLVMVDKHSTEGRIVDQENNMIFRGEDYAAVRRFRMGAAGKLGQLKLA
jgi:DnaB-like helicase C terminal domain/Toprim-like/DNA primase catalytic core, N-terminal domain